jgi:hypothetical protein
LPGSIKILGFFYLSKLLPALAGGSLLRTMRDRGNKTMVRKKQIIIYLIFSASAILIVFGAIGRFSWANNDRTASLRFGYHALKINGRYVSEAIFQEEQNKFYERWHRNGDMLRKSDEERNDQLLDEIIARAVIEDYLMNRLHIKIKPIEVEQYINRYIKSKYTTPSEISSYLDSVSCSNENDLKRMVELYLVKMKYFPKIARQYGITVTEAEIEEQYQCQKNESRNDCYHPRAELTEMLLMERFANSVKFQDWLNKIKSQMEIKILEPSMNAYRNFKLERYNMAGQLYERTYHLYKLEFYFTRALESYRLAKNWHKMIQLGQYGIYRFVAKVPYYLYTAEGLYNKAQIKKALELLKTAENLSAGNIVYKNLTLQTYSRLGIAKNATQ